MNEEENKEETMSTAKAVLTLVTVGGALGLAFGVVNGCCELGFNEIKYRIQKQKNKKLLKEYKKESEEEKK